MTLHWLREENKPISHGHYIKTSFVSLYERARERDSFTQRYHWKDKTLKNTITLLQSTLFKQGACKKKSINLVYISETKTGCIWHVFSPTSEVGQVRVQPSMIHMEQCMDTLQDYLFTSQKRSDNQFYKFVKTLQSTPSSTKAKQRADKCVCAEHRHAAYLDFRTHCQHLVRKRWKIWAISIQNWLLAYYYVMMRNLDKNKFFLKSLIKIPQEVKSCTLVLCRLWSLLRLVLNK